MDVAWTAHLDGEEATRYDAFVLGAADGHVLQTRQWAAVARAGAPVTTRFVTVRDGARLVGTALVVRPVVAGIPLPWAWIERGPVVGDVSNLAPCVRAIAGAARARGLVRIRVMPYWTDGDAAQAERALGGCGFQDVQRADGAHARTLRIALGGEAELFAGKGASQVRWRAGQAEKAGATARRGGPGDWPLARRMHSTLMEAQGQRARRGSWWSRLEAFASDDARGALFVCDHGGRVVAACVVLRHGAQATYAWGASVPGKVPFTKAVLPLLAAIRWARGAGCTVFDLGGVPGEGDADPKRNTIAALKRDFGGTPVRLAREHARWLVP
jgi:hypothetical protein